MTKLADVVEATAIRPFQVATAPEAELVELRRRIDATRFPERETVTDASQGVQLATMQKLARYWATQYDWRKCEARLQAAAALHHRDRRAGHPLHPRALEAQGRLAGHRHARLARLDRRAAQDHRPADQSHGPRRQRVGRLRRGDPVDTGLRLLGQADHDRLGPRPHRPCLGRADEAPRLQRLRGAGRRLGRGHRRPDGRAGAPRGLLGIHTNMPGIFPADIDGAAFSGAPAPSGLSADEKVAYERLQFVYQKGIAYGFQMGLRPQTLYGIADSPVGLAAYFLDHDARSYELIARVFRRTVRGPYARRHPRQHHDHLVDEHGAFWRPSLLGDIGAKGISMPKASPSRLP